jgi:hypothetical protein
LENFKILLENVFKSQEDLDNLLAKNDITIPYSKDISNKPNFELYAKRSLLGVTEKIDFKTLGKKFTKKKEQLNKVRENIKKVLETVKPKLKQNIKKCLSHDNNKMIIHAKLLINKSAELLNESNNEIEKKKEKLDNELIELEKDYVSVKKEIDLILNLYSESIIGKDNNDRMKYLFDNFDEIHKENLINIIDERIVNLNEFGKKLMHAYQEDQKSRNNLKIFLKNHILSNESVNETGKKENFLYKFFEIYQRKSELEKLSLNEAKTAEALLLNDFYRKEFIKVDSTFKNSYLERYEFVGTFGGN